MGDFISSYHKVHHCFKDTFVNSFLFQTHSNWCLSLLGLENGSIAKALPCKHEDLTLIFNIHLKSQGWYEIGIPVLGRQTQKASWNSVVSQPNSQWGPSPARDIDSKDKAYSSRGITLEADFWPPQVKTHVYTYTCMCIITHVNTHTSVHIHK